MELSKFRILLGMAKSMYKLESENLNHKKAEFWYGFQRGIRRHYHGENFGTDQQHEKWMNCDDGEYRKQLQAGYRAGFICDGEVMEVMI
ncbi:hypothetical protein ES703_52046 [subsurface metagenome]